MNQLWRTTFSIGLLATALASGAAGRAMAQPIDHMKCYRIKDAKTFATAEADLTALQAEFGVEHCTIKSKARELCVPVSKEVTSIEGGSLRGLAGQGQVFDRLCYRVKCPKSAIPAELASDQLGSREIGGFRAVTLCTPAVIGPPPTTTTTTGGPTTTSSTTTTTVPVLSDTFDGSSLDAGWTVLNPSPIDVSVSGGQLHLEAVSNSVWYNDQESILIYKEVTGDFDVTTTVHVAKTSNPAEAPDPEFRLAGILARSPSSGPGTRDTVHVALGTGSVAVPVAAEDKSTDDSSSDFLFYPIGASEGELRMERAGADFSLYHRAIGSGTWQLLRTHNRPDLPATLQVGLMAYDNSAGPPDFTASFDDITFAP